VTPTVTTNYAYNNLRSADHGRQPGGHYLLFLRWRWPQDRRHPGDGQNFAASGVFGALTTYAYNANNQLIQDHPLCQSGQFRATGQYWRKSVVRIHPAASPADEISYSIYDAAGRLAETIDPTGAAKTYQYNGASQLIATTAYANPLVTSTFETAPPTAVVTPAADPGVDQNTTYGLRRGRAALYKTIVDPTSLNANGLNLTTT